MMAGRIRDSVADMYQRTLHGETTLENRSAKMNVFPFLGDPSPPPPSPLDS